MKNSLHPNRLVRCIRRCSSLLERLVSSPSPDSQKDTLLSGPASLIEGLEGRVLMSAAPSAGTFHPVNTPKGFFPIGVFSQPTSSFSTWKGRGVNTLITYEAQGGSVSLDRWNAAAASEGLFTIRKPSGDAAADASDKNLLAYTFQDEPDANGTALGTLSAWYKSAKSATPSIPVFTNFSGGNVLGWQGSLTNASYKSQLANTDWVGSDIYPVTGWNLPSKLNASGLAVRKLSQLSGNKPQFAFIETSNQNLAWLPSNTTGVTPGQFRAEVWDSVIQGARGIAYFPQSFNGFSYDATTPAVAAEMTATNARLTALGGVLESPRNPAGLSLRTTGSLVGSYYKYKGKSYYVVLNMSDTTQSSQRIALGGARRSNKAAVEGEARSVSVKKGIIHDTFSPYAVHVYAVA